MSLPTGYIKKHSGCKFHIQTNKKHILVLVVSEMLCFENKKIQDTILCMTFSPYSSMYQFKISFSSFIEMFDSLKEYPQLYSAKMSLVLLKTDLVVIGKFFNVTFTFVYKIREPLYISIVLDFQIYFSLVLNIKFPVWKCLLSIF